MKIRTLDEELQNANTFEGTETGNEGARSVGNVEEINNRMSNTVTTFGAAAHVHTDTATVETNSITFKASVQTAPVTMEATSTTFGTAANTNKTETKETVNKLSDSAHAKSAFGIPSNIEVSKVVT